MSKIVGEHQGSPILTTIVLQAPASQKTRIDNIGIQTKLYPISDYGGTPRIRGTLKEAVGNRVHDTEGVTLRILNRRKASQELRRFKLSAPAQTLRQFLIILILLKESSRNSLSSIIG